MAHPFFTLVEETLKEQSDQGNGEVTNREQALIRLHFFYFVKSGFNNILLLYRFAI